MCLHGKLWQGARGGEDVAFRRQLVTHKGTVSATRVCACPKGSKSPTRGWHGLQQRSRQQRAEPRGKASQPQRMATAVSSFAGNNIYADYSSSSATWTSSTDITKRITDCTTTDKGPRFVSPYLLARRPKHLTKAARKPIAVFFALQHLISESERIANCLLGFHVTMTKRDSTKLDARLPCSLVGRGAKTLGCGVRLPVARPHLARGPWTPSSRLWHSCHMAI